MKKLVLGSDTNYSAIKKKEGKNGREWEEAEKVRRRAQETR
jgi:hypothetical protein